MTKRPLFFVFLALCAGIWIANVFHIPFLFEQIYPSNHIKNFTPKEPQDICITAIIKTDPVFQQVVHRRIKTTFTAEVLTIGEQQVKVCGLINVVSFDDRDTTLEYGDYILIKGDLSRPGGLRNPGCFNYSEYLARQGIFSVITVKKGDFIAVLAKDKANSFARQVFSFKHGLRALINKYLPDKEGNVLTGILLGDRSGIKDDLKDKFVKTGTVHILAISGLHVGLIALIFILVLKIVRLPRYLVYVGACGLLAVYAVLTGANIPVVRATVMAIAVLIGISLGRKADILNCLGLSGIVILLKNPLTIFDAGFQLSFITVTSIIIFAPRLEGLLKFDYKQHWLIKYLKRSVAVSLGAWLGIVPIIAYHFNIISPICILANIAVVFLLFLVVASGLAFLGIGLLMPFLAEAFGLACAFLINILIKTVTIFSYIPFGFSWTHKWNAFEIIGFYFALSTFALSLYKKRISKSYVVIVVLIFLNILIWEDVLRFTNYPASAGSRYRDDLRITMLDVGHGDAIVLEFPGGGCALIDAGSARGNMDIGEDVVSPYLRSRRIDALDAVFVTHYDEDHSGGIPAILRNFKVRNVFDSLKRADRILGFKDTQILILNPPQQRFSDTASDTNNNSIVMKITSNGHSFLFCADIQEDAMQDLLQYASYLKADFIKIPHHGAMIGLMEEVFLKTVSPKTALISADSKDVSDSLIRMLSAINCRVYKTYFDGAITVRAGKEGLKVETYNR